MKKIFYLALSFLPLMGIVACDDDKKDDKGPENAVEIKANVSGCLNEKSGYSVEDDCLADIYADVENSELTVVLKLVGTCQYTYVDTSFISDDNINIGFYEKRNNSSSISDCQDNCFYEDTIRITGLSKKTYTLKSIGRKYKKEVDMAVSKSFEDRWYAE